MTDLQTALKTAQETHGLTDREIGQLFGVCAVQVRRWKRGVSLPIPGARRTVIEVLRNYTS